jgi:hypothetical protein
VGAEKNIKNAALTNKLLGFQVIYNSNE